jgi:hypothetical protein
MILSSIFSQSQLVKELGFSQMHLRYKKELGRQMFAVILVLFLISILIVGLALPRLLGGDWIIDVRLVIAISASFSTQLLTYPTIGILSALEKFDIQRNFSIFKFSTSIILCLLFTFIDVEWINFALIFYLVQILSNLSFMALARTKSATL